MQLVDIHRARKCAECNNAQLVQGSRPHGLFVFLLALLHFGYDPHPVLVDAPVPEVVVGLAHAHVRLECRYANLVLGVRIHDHAKECRAILAATNQAIERGSAQLEHLVPDCFVHQQLVRGRLAALDVVKVRQHDQNRALDICAWSLFIDAKQPIQSLAIAEFRYLFDLLDLRLFGGFNELGKGIVELVHYGRGNRWHRQQGRSRAGSKYGQSETGEKGDRKEPQDRHESSSIVGERV